MTSRQLKLPLTLGALAFLALGASTLQGCSDDDTDAPHSSAGTGGTSPNATAGTDSGDGGSSTPANGGSGGTIGGTAPDDGEAGNLNDGEAGTPPVLGGGEGGAASGSDPGVGGASNNQDALCAKFCDDEAAICTDDLVQYADRPTCLAECDGWNRGFVGDTAGNTLDCRIYHLDLAATDADSAMLHCPHTGAHPNSFCLD